MIDSADNPMVVVDQLTARYPDRSRDMIEQVVRRHWSAYDDAAVRAFVPVLVGRQAAAELRHH
jgi:hypothetical protein